VVASVAEAVRLIAATLALLPLAALARAETWTSIKSTGGLVVSAPFHSTDGWLLGIRARLSRLDSKDKRAPHGGLSCVSTQAVVEGSNIYLTIVSGEARGPIGAVCPAAKLGEIPQGSYKVFYRGPNEPATLLKEVDLKR
jgi:hypothetical protein